MKNIFVIGSKGIPAKYGGFETFVDNLTAKKVSKDIKYYVSCMSDENSEFTYNGATCFNVKVPDIGSAKAILYDLYSLNKVIEYIRSKNIEKNSIVYILACRIGPFMSYYKNIFNKMGVKIFVNPDGHEWKRSKWNYLTRKYWKISERLMVKHADKLICDSRAIEKYIKEDYSQYSPMTEFIAYGADVKADNGQNYDNQKLNEWFIDKGIESKDYYLVVGRFIPENNYELMIREFMNSTTKKDFVLITNIEKNSFYNKLLVDTKFNNDKRIKFVGTVYDQELLTSIRENAFGYFHGHEVGGTNPSLLEALATTNLNLLLDVAFNKEVGKEGAVYFSKEPGSLSFLINEADEFTLEKINLLSNKAKERILNNYSWELIIMKYEELFLNS